MIALRNLISVFFLSFLVISCRDCGPEEEPELHLTFSSKQAIRIDTLYGVGAVGKLPVNSPGTNSFILPLNLNADSTRYIVRLNGREESITVHYQRLFTYKDAGCGYVINLEEPFSRPDKARTTIGAIEYVSYSQNYYGSGLNNGPDTAIRLSIRL